MKVLVACEFSGRVRNAFRDRGHEAYSCDLLETDQNKYEGIHYQCDVLDIFYTMKWDLMIAHPPCTYLCSSGLHWNSGNVERQLKTLHALEFVKKLLNAPIDKICLENPIGKINTAIRRPDQYIQPYEFGHDAGKKTGLWLKNLP